MGALLYRTGVIDYNRSYLSKFYIAVIGVFYLLVAVTLILTH